MLCAKANESYAVIDLKAIGYEEILGVKGNEIIGGIGRCFDGLLIKKALRKCSIVGDLIIGQKLANSTYTGILGKLQSRKVDLYLRGEPDYLQEDWMAKSVPVQMETVTVLNVIRDRSGEVSFFNLLDNFKFGFALSATYLLSFLGILAFAFLFNELTRRLRSGGMGIVRFGRRRTDKFSKRVAWAVSSFGVKRPSGLGIFVLFVHLFLWITQLLLTNNIKTNKVVVDTSELVKDVYDIFATRKLACMLGSGQLANLILNTPTKNVLWRLFYEKTRLTPEMRRERELLGQENCWITSERRMFELLHSDVFVAGERNSINMLLAIPLLFVDESKRVWVGQRKFYEYPLALYFNVEKPWLGKAILRNSENGLVNRMYRCFDQAAKASCRASKTSLFETVDEYVEDLSGFSDLVLPNFSYIFRHYSILCSLVFAAFTVHHLTGLICALHLVSKPLFTLKIFVSCFWPRTDIAQLWIGSIFNYVPGHGRLIIGIAGIDAVLWALSFHFVFNYLNARNDYRLFKVWTKLTLEQPLKSDRDYRVAGLCPEENQKFWSAENRINFIWCRVVTGYAFCIGVVYSSQLFFVRFDGVEIFSATYLLLQAFHVANVLLAVPSFIHCFYSLNLFHMTCMRFFSKRFNCIGRQLKNGSLSNLSAPIDNRKISRLIVDYNRIHHDLILINDFFKFYVGFNLVSFFGFGITSIFVVLLDIDWRIKAAVSSINLILYLTIILFPFVFAKSVTTEIKIIKRRFENIAFHRSVNRTIKQKIESISELSNKAGFTCFDWFLLDPNTGLEITLEFAVYNLLLIQAYYYYTKFQT